MLNDDLLGAYLDGELDAERRAMVERQLHDDKASTLRLERLRGADTALKSAFPATDRDAESFLAASILTHEPPVRRRWVARAGALAAAVVIGLIVGHAMGPRGDVPYSISAQEARLLDTQPSGDVTRIDAGMFEVVLSLRTAGGEMCRQFRLTRDVQSTDVLACRLDDEPWRMVAAAHVASVEGYIPAGANSPLDAAIASFGAVEALDVRAEESAIASGWRPVP